MTGWYELLDLVDTSTGITGEPFSQEMEGSGREWKNIGQPQRDFPRRRQKLEDDGNDVGVVI